MNSVYAGEDMCYIGVDPGVEGAIAIIRHGSIPTYIITDAPSEGYDVAWLEVGFKTGYTLIVAYDINIPRLVHDSALFSPSNTHVAIEAERYFPGDSPTKNIKLMASFSEQLKEWEHFAPTVVLPQKWQARLRQEWPVDRRKYRKPKERTDQMLKMALTESDYLSIKKSQQDAVCLAIYAHLIHNDANNQRIKEKWAKRFHP